ncbi:restriction endonuclease subunit S [Vulcanococcus limneticus]|uniref:restriction endonuclease subunit S n=1 Tax=Vulcanococcus limneticus TaxID=2170428 RepID=UPI00398BD864
MKKAWETKTLGEVCEVFADGDWVERKDQSSEGIRLIQTGNVGEGVYKDRSEKARYISEATFARLRCTEIFEGDCLVSRLPDPVGRSCILPSTGERMITAVDCTILRFSTKQLLPAFFNLYSQSVDYLALVARECTGTTRNRISRSSLARIPIPVPPLPEQQRIVALLDEAFAGLATAKANAERNLQNSRAVFESHLQSVFSQRGEGWVEKPFEELIESNVIGLTKGSRDQGDDKMWPYVKMNNITRDNCFDFTRFTCVDATEEEVNKYSLRDGDFLFNTRNSYELVGKACIYECGSNDAVLFNNNIMRIRFKSEVDARFVLLAFSSKPVSGELNALKSGTTNVSAIYFKDLKSLVVPIPSTDEQKLIAKKLDALSDKTQRLTRLYERKLAALEELKKSLLHQAFNGEL